MATNQVTQVASSPKGNPRRPNVLIILFDDLGFGQMGCFGSEIATPNIDRLAQGGLRYNRFHVTSICSSSRASLLTGRNHHAVNMGNVMRHMPPGTPAGYSGVLPKAAGTLPRILRGAGYNTAAFGKWHLLPPKEESPAGPFDRWPLGLGFERYYGFLRGDSNQWTPNLVRDNHYVEPPHAPREGYHLTEDLADATIKYLIDQHHAAPEKPFFTYFALGAMHTPHHVPQEWSDRYRGRFDEGWDRMRERVFNRQLESGVAPSGTLLTPRPSWVEAWDALNPDERRLFARMHEVYAGYLSHTDAQIGRIITCLEQTDQLDNTIVMVTSDNGASAEGGPLGTFNEHRNNQRLADSLEGNLAHLDGWGGFRAYYHYAWGWAWAGNTPFRLWKRYAWLGGTRTPLIVHWPNHIRAKNEIRQQIIHIIDVMPTVLELSGVPAPDAVDGITQQRIDGKSFANSFNDAAAPSPRDKQYFEMRGSRAIISGQWKATTDHVQGNYADEARLLEGSRLFKDDHWGLFDLAKDFSEATDVSEKHPDVVRELQELWHVEAGRNNVLPLMDGGAVPFFHDHKPDQTAATHAKYLPGGSPIRHVVLPRIRGGARISAAVDVPATGAQGILCALGDWNSGYALYVIEGRLRFALNRGGDVTLVVASESIPLGRHELGITLTPSQGGVTLTLDYDGLAVGVAVSSHALPDDFAWQIGGTALCIGFDRGFPVSTEYAPPFAWTGVLFDLTIDARPPPRPDLREEIRAALHSD